MPHTESTNTYGLVVGFIYIFNLIVGTGALTMPKAFENSGIILSAILLIFLTFMSFITATFMFEAMSITNAIKKLQRLQAERQDYSINSYINPVYVDEDRISSRSSDKIASSKQKAINNNDEDENEEEEDENENTSEQRPLIGSSSYSHSTSNPSISNTTNARQPLTSQHYYYRRNHHHSHTSSRADPSGGPGGAVVEQDGNGGGTTSIESSMNVDNLFNINYKFEMGEMAGIYFSKMGKLFFYLAMILYLYGDLAIYDAAVPKSLRDTTCTWKPDQPNVTITDEDICWPNVPQIDRLNAYRIYVLAFNLTIGVLVFYNVQKTKLLQMLTTVMRWLAFVAMISLAVRKIYTNSLDPHDADDDADNNGNVNDKVSVNLFDLESVPNFFGVCIYAFMCHHSLPGIITPMRRKENYKRIFVTAYLCIMVFYLLLSTTAVFAFGSRLEDFYTLNFAPSTYDKSHGDSPLILVIDYYLALFPVFTISASFPIIGITLRNNLKSLYYFALDRQDDEASLVDAPLPSTQRARNYFVSIVLPLVTLTPPLVISLITHDLQLLVGFTGSYAGVAIQYVIPCCLVYFGRKQAVRVFRQNFHHRHAYTSPFKSKFWVFFVLLWANVAIVFVTLDHIFRLYKH